MAQHIHASFKQIPPAVLALIKEQAITAERPTQAQLENIALQMQQNAAWTELANKGIVPPASTELVDAIVKRAQNRFDANTKNKGDRDAERKARANEPIADRIVRALGESLDEFNSQREQTKKVLGSATLIDEAYAAIVAAFSNLFNARFSGERVTPASYKLHCDHLALLTLEVA